MRNHRFRSPRLYFLFLLAGVHLCAAGINGTGSAWATPAGSTPAGPVQVFSLVVGVNQPPDAASAQLLYADDDAILFYQMLSGMGSSVLLTDPDSNTRRVHGDLEHLTPRLPTKENLRAALGELFAQMRQVKARGATPHFYFFYSGHGEVKNNQGQLTLADGGTFSTEDLSQLVLGASPAAVNHVIVDACQSYYLVQEKKAGGQRQRIDRPFSHQPALARRFPNAGFLLSTSSAVASHEWEEFQSGIFSHEVRSGLSGAADINGDGQVSYKEIWAFVQVANAAIPNDRFRPRIFVQPPRGDADKPLLDLRSTGALFITIPADRAGRYFLEDAMGVRLVDLHSTSAGPVTLRLPIQRRAYLYDLQRHLEYAFKPEHQQRLAALNPRPSSYRPKGAAHEAFTRIFEHPFSLDAYNIQLQCINPATGDTQCPSYACAWCHCERCRRGSPLPGAPASVPPVVSRPAPPTVAVERPFRIALLVGSGGGFIAAGESEHLQPYMSMELAHIKLSQGFAPSLLHLMPEITYALDDRWQIGVETRIQLINGVTVDSGMSVLAEAKLAYHFGHDIIRPYFAATVGGGQIRHRIALGNYDSDPNSPDNIVDTRVSGPVSFGLTGGLIIGRGTFRLILEANGRILFPSFAAHLDLNIGPAIAF